MHIVERARGLGRRSPPPAGSPPRLRRRHPVPGAAGPDARGTSRSRSWPTTTATSSTWASASARCSAATRRSSRKRRRRCWITARRRGIRARIGEAACKAARSVHYSGAGTVEFLVSDDAPDEFFFMEMNTRLQVEHPVTEMVTGVDLVEWQVRIAAGEELTVAQADVVLTGHAVEARVYAEMPSGTSCRPPGLSSVLDEPAPPSGPATWPATRSDNPRPRADGLGAAGGPGDLRDYDPMIAKVIAWGQDRTAALDTLDDAARRVHRARHRHQRRVPAAADQRRRRPRRPSRHRPDRAQDAASRSGASATPNWSPPPCTPWRRRSATGTPSADRGGAGRLAARRAGCPGVSLGTPDGGIATVCCSRQRNLGWQRPCASTTARYAGRRCSSAGAATMVLTWTVDGPGYRLRRSTPDRSRRPRRSAPGVPTELFLGNDGWSCRLEVAHPGDPAGPGARRHRTRGRRRGPGGALADARHGGVRGRQQRRHRGRPARCCSPWRP